MRVHFLVAALAALAALAASCTDPNRIIVHNARIDDRSTPDVGDEYEFERLPALGHTAEQKSGFFVVHGDHDWLMLWTDPRPDAKPPPPPQGIDYTKRMIFIATATDDNAKSIEVQKVVSLYSGLHIYITETLLGSGCPPQVAKRPMDVISLDTVPYDIHVHLDRIHADTCGPPPDAVVLCRIAGSGTPATDKIAASVGDTVDCDGSKSKPQIGTIVDRSWQISSLPLGSTAKLTVGKESMGVTFPVDAWGTYSIGLSVHDNAREGSAGAVIDAPAPEGGIELYWSHVPRDLDPSTLPRSELHVVELPFAVGAGLADCNLQAAKPWCEVHTAGAMQQAVLHAESGKRYRVSIKYLDERRPGGPLPCVRAFPRGAPAVSTCEADETARKANALWDLGALDPATGNFYDPRKPKPPPPPPPAAGVDAGAPVSTAKPDAGAAMRPPPPPASAKPPTDIEF